jgi:glycosyltransferase involved in cell wall biosynthesis
MHVLWISDSPDTPSGFGNVTRQVAVGLARRGHRVSIIGWQCKKVAAWEGCTVYPVHHDPMGSDATYAALVRLRPDVVVALADIWWLPYVAAPHIRQQLELTRTPWVLYFPVDGHTDEGSLPPSWVELLREVDVPVAMSRYGQRIVRGCGIDCEYVPHGVDLDVFRPPANRAEAKARAGLPGRFVVLSDSRNQPRKLLPRLLDVFTRFAAARPNAVLHLHTDADDEFARSRTYSYDLRADIRHLAIEDRVHLTGGFKMAPGSGLPLAQLAAYYQAADVHLLASSGEGFGLPTLQAAAAGVVPMAAAYSASSELVSRHGTAIRVADWTRTEFGILRAMIDVDDAVDALVRYHDDAALLAERVAAAREFAVGYSWNAVTARWDELLCGLAERRRGGLRDSARTARPAIVEKTMQPSPGASVTVRMVERQFGRLEAAIAADARGHPSEVRVPTVPAAVRLAGAKVPRRAGLVLVPRAPEDTAALDELRHLFPVLHGHDPSEPVPASTTRPPMAPSTRLAVASSVLVLNVGGRLGDDVVAMTAECGVPCVGVPSAAQLRHWPTLCADRAEEAVAIARSLLTDAALVRRLCQVASGRPESPATGPTGPPSTDPGPDMAALSIATSQISGES